MHTADFFQISETAHRYGAVMQSRGHGKLLYTVNAKTCAVLGPDRAEAFSTEGEDFTLDERLEIAWALCDLANGGLPDLPACIDSHWAVSGGLLGNPGRLHVKTPASASGLSRSRIWTSFATTGENDLALRIADTVNERRGWLITEAGYHRNVVANKPVVVYLEDRGWRLTVSGIRRGVYDALDAAKQAAAFEINNDRDFNETRNVAFVL